MNAHKPLLSYHQYTCISFEVDSWGFLDGLSLKITVGICANFARWEGVPPAHGRLCPFRHTDQGPQRITLCSVETEEYGGKINDGMTQSVTLATLKLNYISLSTCQYLIAFSIFITSSVKKSIRLQKSIEGKLQSVCTRSQGEMKGIILLHIHTYLHYSVQYATSEYKKSRGKRGKDMRKIIGFV